VKPAILTILSASLIFGASMTAFAEESSEGKGTINFGQMKPMMEKMHPDLSADELKQMYLDCHGTNGAMPSKNFNMMDGSHMDIVD
jgi:hypothetical protein